jgi:hypothetical protein
VGNTYEVVLGHAPHNDLWPWTLFNAAKSFAVVADAATVKLGPLDVGSAHYLTILFLLAQSIELALKAFLRGRGTDQEKLKDIGHALPKALSTAVKVGFRPPHSADLKLLELLDTTYRVRKRLQYPVASSFKMPLVRPVRELAQLYLTEVLRAVCGLVDLRAVEGLAIDPVADYGSTTLEQFRVGAEGFERL